MAIEQARKTSFGVPARYHRIMAIEVSYPRRLVKALLASFATEQSRQTGAEPLATEWHEIQFQRLASEEPTRAQIYAALRSTEAFKDAVDV